MKIDLHLVFTGQCSEAFAFYEKTFNGKIQMCMKYGESPQPAPVPPEYKDKVMHMAMPLGGVMLMGCDSPPGSATPMGGFQVSVSATDEAEAKRIFAALSESGSVQMPLMKTFWSPLFGMCTDKFGVAWMVGLPGPEI